MSSDNIHSMILKSPLDHMINRDRLETMRNINDYPKIEGTCSAFENKSRQNATGVLTNQNDIHVEKT